MNKSIRTLLVSVFAISLVLMAGSSTVLAEGWANPWVTPVSGDLVFTSTAVAPVTLAGAEKTDGGLIVPVGFPTGERQFGGNALVVSGLSGGTANACFSFPTYRYGWRGGVYEWTGSKWMPLPTTIGNPEAKEGAPSTACAPIYGSGTYALIINFNAGEAPENTCAYDTSEWFLQSDSDEGGRWLYAHVPEVPEDSLVTYVVLDMEPEGYMTGAMSGSGTVNNYVPDSFEADFLGYYVEFHDQEGVVTVRVTTMGCSKVLTFTYGLEKLPDDFIFLPLQ